MPTTTQPATPAVGVLRRDGWDGRAAVRSRAAGAVLVLVLLAVSVFAVWSSQATSAAATRAVTASGLSDDYARAASAVAGEESLERKYRLEPGPDVRARYDKVAATLVSALGEVREDGDARDRALVDDILGQHRAYLEAINRLFAATERGDTATALRVDNDEVDPSFGAIEEAIVEAAEAKHQISLSELVRLQRLEGVTRRLTPVVFLVGLLIAAVSSTGFDGDHQATEDQAWSHQGSTRRSFGSGRSA